MNASRRLVAIASIAAVIVPAAAALAPAASALGTVAFYAYADGNASEPASCPQTSTVNSQCTLLQALNLAEAADGTNTIYLATPGATKHYVGNWEVTSDVTIQPADGVADPTLDGNEGDDDGCQTAFCDSAILLNQYNSLNVAGVTFVDGDNSLYGGGAIDNADGGDATLVVSDSTFTDNTAEPSAETPDVKRRAHSRPALRFRGPADGFGGAINNGDNNGNGDVTIINSTFEGNSAEDGGAIQSGTDGTSSLTVTGSTFDDNQASDTGGAIASGGEDVSTSVAESTFYDNAPNAIVADSLTVIGSTFTHGRAESGDAIDGLGEFSPVTVAGNLFAIPCEQNDQPWIDAGFNAATPNGDTDGGETCLVEKAKPKLASSRAVSHLVLGNGDVVDDAVGNIANLADNGGPTETDLPDSDNPAIGAIPTGTSVTVGDGSTDLCPRTDQRGVDSTGACSAGSVDVTATGGGGGGTPPPEGSRIVLSANPIGSAPAGSTVTLTADLDGQVFGGSARRGHATPAPTGTVTFKADGTVLCAAVPVAENKATCATSTLTVGSHDLSAIYSGDANFPAGTGIADYQITNADDGTSTPPTITAKVTSAHAKRHGTYRSPVHVTFTCTPGSSPLAGPCPDPVTLRKNGPHTVTRTISDTDGETATVTVHVTIHRHHKHKHKVS